MLTRRNFRGIRWYGVVACTTLMPGALALNAVQLAPSSYVRKDFTIEDGLPDSVVNVIVQSQNSYLWVGTEGGLARFDGEHFTLVHLRGENSREVPVNSLVSASNGDLWVGTDSGLAYVPKAAVDHFDRTLVKLYHPGAGLSDQIMCLRVGREGVVWVGTNRGLYLLDHGNFITVIPQEMISRIEEASNGHLLIITSEGFVEWDGSRLIRHPEVAHQLGVKKNLIFHVFEDHAGVTWFCTAAGVARRVNGSVQRLSPYEVSPTGNTAYRAYEDGQSNIWIVTQKGVFRVAGSHLEPLDPTLLATTIYTRIIYSDREGDLWIGTGDTGLIRLKRRIIRIYTEADGLPNDRVETLLAGHDGTLWVGNNCGGLSKFDGKRFTTYSEKDGLSNSCVWSLAEGHNHDIWVGTWGRGLYRFSRGHFTQDSIPQGLPSDIVVSIIVAQDGSLWVATGAGLVHMQNGHLRSYTMADGLSSDRITSVYEDHKGGIWAGTSTGIDRLAGDRFVPVPTPAAVSDVPYNSLHEDSLGNLYALSLTNGISRVADNRILNIHQTMAVSGMVEGGERDLWFSGTQGVSRISVESLERAEADSDSPLDYTSFSREDGLNSRECSRGQPNIVVTPDGKLWTATRKGLAMLDLNQQPRLSHKSPIFVDEVEVGRRRQTPGSRLVLHPGAYHVALHFTAVELASPENVRLQYRLDGVDPDWLDADATQMAIYTQIPAGTHSFHVRASNGDGVWDRAGISYEITQEPYFYETGWFRALCAAALLGLLWGAHEIRLQQVRHDERKLRETIETLPTMAWITGPNGTNQFANRRWVEYTGQSQAGAEGQGWKAVIHPEDMERYVRRWLAAVASGDSFEEEVRIRGADGEYRWFLSRAVALRDKRGKIRRWYGVSTDIEDRKRAEQLQADFAHTSRVSMLGELAASISHELKQPITATITNARTTIRWLEREPPDLDEVRLAAERIEKDGGRAKEIIDHLRSLYKKTPPKRELVDVDEIIGEMALMLRGEGHRFGVSIRTHLGANLPKITADRVQLQQVLMNLMLNGIEAMNATGGVLTVKSEPQDGKVVISVSDTGVGLPAGSAHRIFDAFFTTKPQGSGMGLAISRSIIESHGGRLWATPNDGRGASFHFSLPTSTEAAEAPAAGA
jgi:PAS domain S-box-containing protein